MVSQEFISKLLDVVGADPVLSNQTRLAIMLILLLRGVITFSDLVKVLNVSPSTLETHLNKLAEHGYIEKKKTLYNFSVRTVVKPTSTGIEKTLEYIRRLRVTLEEVVRSIEKKREITTS